MRSTLMATLSIMIMMAIGALYPNQSFALDAEDAPEVVELDALSDLYEPVTFDHAMHVDAAECVECHHHTTGQQPVDPNCLRCHATSEETDSISCGECHSAERFSPQDLKERSNPDLYHIDKPGLKGAYHLNCVGCHEEVDGPTGCQDCHAMTEKGKKQFQVSIVPPKAGSKKDAHE
ncbi:cytochrome c3 family protein [Desulfogranum marinum]|uniref:cytochrome c3 family protein n=1 Tax=Desulfogranum marinum TaxID=453220 RepID=UPI001962926A|nr:cytochrome c3 family protein [Desulfogranum marinum]MBM9512347.1 cytochrome c3 family protein [Desulfogranum marinum]